MQRRFFINNRKINKKNIVLLVVLLITIIIGGCFYSQRDTESGVIEKIKTYISNFKVRINPENEKLEESQISSLSTSSEQTLPLFPDNKTGELTEEALSLEKTKKEVLGETTTAPLKGTKPTLEEIEKNVNEISKKVASVSIQVQILTLEDISSKIGEDEDLGEDELEEISERIDQVSERIESITLQLEQLENF